MKKFTLIIMVCVLLSGVSKIYTQNYIKLDASFYSESLDKVKYVDIYLPPDYYINTDKEYASIYYLHGAEGDQNEGHTDAMWYYTMHEEDTTITSPPAIFVCPDGSNEPYLGSCWMNSELYGTYEDYFMQDVIGFVESNFRAISHKNFRSLVGSSMGGYGSARFSVKYPDMFRACVPCIGFLSMPDTLMTAWRDLYHADNGSYVPTVNNMTNTQLFLTMCGGLSPNLNNPPCYVDFPFDTLGNWVDTVCNKWYQNDLSKFVKDLPDENELSWFMICGTEDYMVTHPTYQVFTDSLDVYGINWDCSYFQGGHVFHPESWMMAIHWLDSIINLEYSTLGVGDQLVRNSKLKVRSYPNPVSEICTLEFKMNSPEIVSFQVFNSAGKKVLQSKSKQFQSGKQQIQINMNGKKEGVYFCRLQIGNEIIIKKIIKVK